MHQQVGSLIDWVRIPFSLRPQSADHLIRMQYNVQFYNRESLFSRDLSDHA